MVGRWCRTLIGRAVILGVLAGAGAGLPAQQVTPVPQFNLDGFNGTWYEVARLPWKREKRCVSDAFLLIAPGQKTGQFQLVNSCKTGTSVAQTANAHGKRADKTDGGKLKISYYSFYVFSTKYWVLAQAPDQSWLLIGSPNHKNLWILSKTPAMQAEVLTDVQARASAQGYAVGKLIFTPASGR